MAIVDDEFDGGSLGGHWTEYDPTDEMTISVSGGAVELDLANGDDDHDWWVDNRDGGAIFQTEGVGGDFEVETLHSLPGDNGHGSGLLAVDDPADPAEWVRFDVYQSGGAQKVFFAHIVFGVTQSIWENDAPSEDPSYLRLNRTGDVWTASYSADGETWVALPTRELALSVGGVGLSVVEFAGANPTPEFQYFHDNLATGGGTPVELEGQADGAATVAGALEVERQLAGTAAGVATASGDLRVAFGGRSDGAATATASLLVERRLSGTAAGTSTATLGGAATRACGAAKGLRRLRLGMGL